MSLKSTWDMINDEAFRGRVTVAVYKSAVNILNGDDPVDSARYKMANEAKEMATLIASTFMWHVASNPSISAAGEESPADVPDGDIEYVVASEWDLAAFRRYPIMQDNSDNMNPVVELPTIPEPEVR